MSGAARCGAWPNVRLSAFGLTIGGRRPTTPSVSRLRSVLLAAALLGATAAVPSGAAAATPAPARAGAATPQLIDAALASGKIDDDVATVLRAQALNADPAMPAAYRSTTPWEGTATALQVRSGLKDLGPKLRARALAASSSLAPESTHCGDESSADLPDRIDTTHFRIDSGAITGGLTASDYGTALETAWAKQVGEYGWAAPPLAAGTGGHVHVRVDDLGASGLLGYVTNDGTYGASSYVDNPNTTWDDVSAVSSCMVLNSRFGDFGVPAAGLLSSTSAHEFNHVLQFGYGAIGSDIQPDTTYFEGGATFMEQDTQADDTALGHPFPSLTESMGDYDVGLFSDPYTMFYRFRGIAERFGVGVAGGEEQVLQDFWEGLSQRTHGGQMGALEHALVNQGTTLGAAFNDFGIAAEYMEGCGGGFPAGRCWQDAALYRAHETAPPYRAGQGAAQGGTPYEGSVADDFAVNWVRLPWSHGAYDVTLANTSAGGALRTSVTCRQGSGLGVLGTIATRTAGQSGTTTIDPSACTSAPMVVLTNESTPSDGNPDASALRSYRVSVSTTTSSLRVQRTLGPGTGTVTLTPDDGSQPTVCSSSCTVDYAPGTHVALTAAGATADDTFLGFSGGGCVNGAPCTVNADGARTIYAGFGSAPHDTSRRYVFTSSSGFLTVTSDIGHVFDPNRAGAPPCDRPATCLTDFYEDGTPVTLTAHDTSGAGQHQVFRGWQGPGTDECIETSRECTIDFEAAGFSFTPITAVASTYSDLTWSQTGQGRIVMSAMGEADVDCPGSCVHAWGEGLGPAIQAIPAPGWRFVAFGAGDCRIVLTYTPKCGVETMDRPRTVHGTFEPIPQFTLTAATAGAGTGTVASLPSGIACGATCTHDYDDGTEVTLTATPAAGSIFTGWSGACTASAGTCTVTLSQARSATATFVPTPRYTLTVAHSGGDGIVRTGDNADLDCGATCSVTYVQGTGVVLVADAAGGSQLIGWTGACAGQGRVCLVTLADQDLATTAIFSVSTPVDDTPPAGDPQPDVPETTPAVPSPVETAVLPYPTPNATAPVSLLTPPAAATPKPTAITVAPPARQSTANVIKKGFAVTLTSAVAAKVTATLTVDAKTAKKLGLTVKGGSAVAGTGSGRSGPAGGKLVVKLNPKATRKAKGAGRIKAMLVLTTVGPGGVPVVTRKSVTIG
jgi:hypothetical protein